ncbi:MAG TPA: sensor histidine kinase [Actinomycetota bacterium]|nr:sensor histidine kinase [Actinomycetota bacterium]
MEQQGMWGRLRRVDHRIWDALLALALLAGGVLGLVLQPRPDAQAPVAVGVALLVAQTVPIAWRRRAPLVVAAAVVVSDAALTYLGYEATSGISVGIALYTAAAYEERSRMAPVLGVLAAVAVPVAFVVNEGNWVETALGVIVIAGIPITFGRIVYNRRARIVHDRELAAREAVSVERARIARELHDVVAHHMSVMVVQAGAARAVVGTDAAATTEALRQIEASGRAGLTEMRRLLEILKSGEPDGARAPQPGLERLDDLLEGMRATGLPVEAVVEGTPQPLSPGVDLSAYRIVQEALTNTLKHAGEAHARVLLRYGPDALEIEVADDGRGAVDTDGGGQGLIGMRERVQLFGGTLNSGPRPGGGFLVRARLPLLEGTSA